MWGRRGVNFINTLHAALTSVDLKNDSQVIGHFALLGSACVNMLVKSTQGILAVGGGFYTNNKWNWNPVVQLWTVNQTTNPITFTKVVEINWFVAKCINNLNVRILQND
jgi:hypothetical protein